MKSAYPKIKNMSPLFVVVDLERSLDFYTKNFGFVMEFRYHDFYAGIIKDGYSVHLKSGGPPIAERANMGDRDHVDLVLTVEDIDKLFEAVKALPVTIVQPLRQMPYGHEFYISDPDGYILGFLEIK